MVYSCRANAALAGVNTSMMEQAFQYGRNIGIAFQLVDDLLDFIVSADQLANLLQLILSWDLLQLQCSLLRRFFPSSMR